MGIIKFLVSILLVPVVYAVTRAFALELIEAKYVYQMFSWGILTYVGTHLFLVNFKGMYQGGQKLLSDAFKFSPFLAGFIPLVLPVFPVVLMLTLYIVAKFYAMELWEPYIVFFTGLTFAMHLILTAQILREEDTGVFKAHYFFVMALGYIFNILLMAALFDLNSSLFSFIKFFDQSVIGVKEIYFFIYSRLAQP